MDTVSHPLLYEVNTRVWLRELSRSTGARTLADVPDAELDRWAALGFDWIWLMGVWTTGPAGRGVSRTHPQWRAGYRETLGDDLREDDIIGSPFAVRDYAVDPALGGDAALAALRGRMRERGLRLMLDFVPNHTALDHPWAADRPELYVAGTGADLAARPHDYARVSTPAGERILAHGRDPYFPGWPDTLQLDYRRPALREAMRGELLRVAARCDGARCDMAMLLLPHVFARTWGDTAEPFWPGALEDVRQAHPDFVFVAEVYWDLEWELQQQGFHYTYDKRLYDRLREGSAEGVRGHLSGDPAFQRRLVRFLENHDEARAARAFAPDAHRAAAVVAFLSPGMRFFHEGQPQGRRVKSSVHLGRRPPEPDDPVLAPFYQLLLAILRRPEVREGEWRLPECRPAWEGDESWRQLVVHAWEGAGRRLLAAVNYSPRPGHCRVRLPFAGLAGRRWALRDLLGPEHHLRDGGELAGPGLYLALGAWGHNVFEVVEQP